MIVLTVIHEFKIEIIGVFQEDIEQQFQSYIQLQILLHGICFITRQQVYTQKQLQRTMKMYKIYGLNQSKIKKERFSIQLRPSPNKMTSRSKGKDPKISQIEALSIYETIQKPTLNDEKLERLKRQLALDQQAKKNYLKRKQQNNLIINFDFNPFSRQQIQSKDPKAKQHIQVQKSFRQQKKQLSDDPSPNKENQVKNIKKLTNIIESIEAFRSKRLHFNKEEENFPLGQLSFFVPKINSNLNSRQLHVSPQPMKSSKNVLKNETKSPINQKRKDSVLFPQAMDFQNIKNIKQKSFYLTNQRIDNIFHMVFRKDKNIKMGNQILDQYYFCNDSVKEVSQNKKVFIYRDISKTSRNFIRNLMVKEQLKVQFQDIKEVHVSIDNITIDSILSVAAGRSNSEDIFNLLNEKIAKVMTQNVDQGSSDEVDEQIQYADNTENVSILKTDDNQYGNQIEQFNQISLDYNQIKYKKYLDRQVQIFKEILNQQNFMNYLRIQDRNTLNMFSQRKFNQLIDMLGKHTDSKQDKDRLIRIKKLSKNKMEQLKIKSLIEALILRKKNEEKLRSKQQNHL